MFSGTQAVKRGLNDEAQANFDATAPQIKQRVDKA